MSELNIRIRKLQDNGSTFRTTPETLYMGGVGSAKVDTLRFEVPEEWNGCAISLHVQRLSGALPDPQLLDENHCVVVDKRWTKEKQGSWMLLAMNDAGYIAMTKPGQYTCYETIDLNSTTETIPQSIYAQFVAATLNYANQALASRNAAGEKAEEAKGHAGQAEQAKTDAQTAAQQAGESAEKAGQALSDTIAAKDNALKAIDEKQTSAEQIVDIARSRAVSQVRAAGERAKTDVRAAASEAATSAGNADQSAQEAGASAEKAGQALSDTIAAKDDALKAIDEKQTTATQAVDTARDKAIQQVEASTEAAQTAATQAVDTARDKALQQVEASTEAAQTAASEAATSAGNADQSAQEAAGSLQKLKDGIASGDFKGEPGNDGESPVVTVTAIENGHRISITDKDGTQTIDVLDGKDGKDGTQIDDTTVGPDAWSSKHIVDMLCPPLEETGNPVQCYPVAGYPLGCKVSWEPTQEGAGDPSPENVRPIKGRDSVMVTRCGENLLNIAPFTKLVNKGITYEYVTNGGVHISGTATASSDSPTFAVGHLPPGKYFCLDVNADFYSSIVVRRNGANLWLDTKGVFEILAGDVIKYWYMIVTNGTTLDTTVYPYIVPGTTAPTTYAPYTGQTATLTLPHTIYGGTVDAVTGEGQETWKLVTLDGTENWQKKETQTYIRYTASDLPEDAEVNTSKDCFANVLCNVLPSTDTNKKLNGIQLQITNKRMIMISVEGIDSLEDFVAWVKESAVQIAYKLAKPVPFTATGAQPIPALSGVNTVLTDSDSVTVTGRADPIKRIIDLEDAVASMT